MLIIRLQRTGKKNQADFRIVLAEKEAPVQKKFVEVLGSYNPRKKYFQVNEARLKYWLDQRISLSETVHNLLVTKTLMQGPKVKAFNIPKKKEEAKVEAKPAEAAAAAPVIEAKPEETAPAPAEAAATVAEEQPVA